MSKLLLYTVKVEIATLSWEDETLTVEAEDETDAREKAKALAWGEDRGYDVEQINVKRVDRVR